MLLKMQMDKWRGHKSPSFAAQRLSAHDRFFASPPHIRCISGSSDSCTSGPHSAARDTAISSISRMVRLKNVLGTRSTKKVAQGNFCSRKAGKVHECEVRWAYSKTQVLSTMARIGDHMTSTLLHTTWALAFLA